MPPRRMRVAGRRKRRSPMKGRWSNRGRQVQNKQPVHYFKRSYYTQSAIVASGANNYFAISHALNSLPNYTEFTALYDQYKITGVKVKFLPRGNSSDVNTGNQLASLFTVIDKDDTVVPTSIDQLTQYENVKMCRSSQMLTRYWKPNFNIAAVNTVAGGIIGKQNTKGWLDVTDDAIQHFGIKGGLTAFAGNTVVYDIVTTVYMAFKNVR